MTQKQILEGNKLIAKFMGWKKDNSVSNERYYKEGYISKNLCNFSYNKSWDWLMQVVEKIENLYDGEVLVEISDESCYIGYHKLYESYSTMTTKIEATWHAVIEFIKWYNGLETGK